MRHKWQALFPVVVLSLAGKAVIVSAADSDNGQFRAGAARIDITPSMSAPVAIA